MHYRNIGNSGLRVSEVGLGCNNFGSRIEMDASVKILHRAVDLGITLFDTAPVYGGDKGRSEAILGEAFRGRRNDLVLSTKFGLWEDFSKDVSRRSIVKQVETSLQRLKTDYIDLYFMHCRDPFTPMEEILRAMDDLITAGKVRYIGCSNIPVWQVVESKWLSKTDRLHSFIVTQNEYSLAAREVEKDMLPAVREYGMGLMPYAPLANGLLTGKFSRGKSIPAESRLAKNQYNTGDRFLTEAKLDMVEELGRFARDRGHTLLELAVSWLLAQPAVCSVIAGATSEAQLEKNASAANMALSAEELALIDEICRKTGNL